MAYTFRQKALALAFAVIAPLSGAACSGGQGTGSRTDITVPGNLQDSGVDSVVTCAKPGEAPFSSLRAENGSIDVSNPLISLKTQGVGISGKMVETHQLDSLFLSSGNKGSQNVAVSNIPGSSAELGLVIGRTKAPNPGEEITPDIRIHFDQDIDHTTQVVNMYDRSGKEGSAFLSTFQSTPTRTGSVQFVPGNGVKGTLSTFVSDGKTQHEETLDALPDGPLNVALPANVPGGTGSAAAIRFQKTVQGVPFECVAAVAQHGAQFSGR